MEIQIEIGPGELFDRFSILLIKFDRLYKKIREKELNAIHTEKEKLRKDVNKLLYESIGEKYLTDIRKVNEKLWDLEEKVRWHERNQDFSEGFIEAARLIYITNDERSKLKNKINEICGSDLEEVKSYQKY